MNVYMYTVHIHIFYAWSDWPLELYLLESKSELRLAYIHSSKSKSSLNILCHPKGYPLRNSKTFPLLKAHVVVDMHHLASGKLHQ